MMATQAPPEPLSAVLRRRVEGEGITPLSELEEAA